VNRALTLLACAATRSGGLWKTTNNGITWAPISDSVEVGAGTYGRGIFIGDITHLQELSAEALTRPLHLFGVEPRAAYGFRAQGNYHLYGHKYIEVPNEPDALVINYYLRERHDGGAQVTISNINGEQIAQMKGASEAGLNRASWNMRAGAGAPSGGGRGRGGFGSPLLPAGDYRIPVAAGGRQQTTIGRIRERIGTP
jgi:hypothetical protein